MTETAIETTSLTRRFANRTAVDELNQAVPRAGVYGFLGPNGAGKTTTIRRLLGLIRPDAGTVRLFGEPLEQRRLALMRRVGALVETPSLYPHLTGAENLEVTRRLLGADRKLTERALSIVKLTEDAQRKVREYSPGMRQRLGLALGTGIAGTFFALFAASVRLGKFYPWLLPVNIFIDERFTVALLPGAVGGVIAAVIGCIEFTRRDVV